MPPGEENNPNQQEIEKNKDADQNGQPDDKENKSNDSNNTEDAPKNPPTKPGIMVHAGYLNDQEEVKGGAAEIFFKHRDDVIKEKTPSNEDYAYIPQGNDIRNRFEFPTFYVNWIDGIYASCLRILNHFPSCASNYKQNFITKPPPAPPEPGPIHDPYFVHSLMPQSAQAKKPEMDAAALAAYFIQPGLTGKSALASQFQIIYPPTGQNPPEDAKAAQFEAGMAKLGTIPQYTKRQASEFIPDLASDEFPNLDYGDSELSLKNKQELLFEAIVKSYDDLVNAILENPTAYFVPIGLLGIAPSTKPPVGQEMPGPGLIPIFQKAKQSLDKNLPEPAADNAITNIANYEALKRALTKPLCLAAIGVLFGSHPEGFVNKMGLITPDPVLEYNLNYKDVKPAKLNIEQEAEAEAINMGGYAVAGVELDGDNIPMFRPFVAQRFPRGKGMKSEFYRKLKELGETFISPGDANEFADANHRGLAFLMVFWHETACDPGTANENNSKQYAGDGTPSDALIWAAKNSVPMKPVSSMTMEQFNNSPVLDPYSLQKNLRGMDVMEQLFYYEEWLTCCLAMLGSEQQAPPDPKNPNTQAPVITSAGRAGLQGPYLGPDPYFTNQVLNGPHSARLLKHLEAKEHMKEKYKDWVHMTPPKYIPENMGGTAAGRKSSNKGYREPFYYMQTPYDIYGFHIGLKGSGELIIGRPGPDAVKKHQISYTMTQRNYHNCLQGEHIPRYMQAVGMERINWNQVGVIGMHRYVDEYSKPRDPNRKLFIDPIPFGNECSTDFIDMNNKYQKRYKQG
jgi:hypothetical protein